jgi:hypothetical protein
MELTNQYVNADKQNISNYHDAGGTPCSWPDPLEGQFL